MIIPIRCFSCGKLVADKFEKFTRRVKDGEDPIKVFEDLGLKRWCCRRMITSHVDVIDDIMHFA